MLACGSEPAGGAGIAGGFCASARRHTSTRMQAGMDLLTAWTTEDVCIGMAASKSIVAIRCAPGQGVMRRELFVFAGDFGHYRRNLIIFICMGRKGFRGG